MSCPALCVSCAGPLHGEIQEGEPTKPQSQKETGNHSCLSLSPVAQAALADVAEHIQSFGTNFSTPPRGGWEELCPRLSHTRARGAGISLSVPCAHGGNSVPRGPIWVDTTFLGALTGSRCLPALSKKSTRSTRHCGTCTSACGPPRTCCRCWCAPRGSWSRTWWSRTTPCSSTRSAAWGCARATPAPCRSWAMSQRDSPERSAPWQDTSALSLSFFANILLQFHKFVSISFPGVNSG